MKRKIVSLTGSASFQDALRRRAERFSIPPAKDASKQHGTVQVPSKSPRRTVEVGNKREPQKQEGKDSTGRGKPSVSSGGQVTNTWLQAFCKDARDERIPNGDEGVNNGKDWEPLPQRIRPRRRRKG